MAVRGGDGPEIRRSKCCHGTPMALRLQASRCGVAGTRNDVNHKQIARMMREDNLLEVRGQWVYPPRRSLRIVRVHLNLASRMTLSGPDQLWAADSTYIRLAREFVYLAVILDVFSRKIIGWALGRSLKAQLPLLALDRAAAVVTFLNA